MNRAVGTMRTSYERATLGDQEVNADPIAQFAIWFEEARTSTVKEANAMILSTVDSEGHPSARTVLLKGFDADGFVFYSNYESRKGREMAANPFVALTFYWGPLERQVRVTGVVERVPAGLSDTYFESRPEGSRIGAVASPQSEEIPNRAWLEERVSKLTASLEEGEPLKRPEWWGGYRVRPVEIEFWQGRPNRLHDRIRFLRDETGSWTHARLAP